MKSRPSGTTSKEYGDRIHRASLGQLRALAHPVRLRMLELFAETPRTTKQVANLLGEPPTRLYHHAAALERAGLLRLARTKPNRGTIEKFYETPKAMAGKMRGAAAAVQNLASVALDQSRREVELALVNSKGPRPLVARLIALGDVQRVASIRKRLDSLIRDLRRERERKGQHAAGTDQRWVLTITLAPAPLHKSA